MLTSWDHADKSDLIPQLEEIKIILRNVVWNINFFESGCVVYLRWNIRVEICPNLTSFQTIEKYLIV